MKLMNMTLTAIILFALSLTSAQAGNRQVGGLILGSGTGAIVGQAVGHNSEAVIVGAAVGGVVGLIIGNELDKHHRSARQQSTVVVYNSDHHHRRGPEARGHYKHWRGPEARSHHNQYPRFQHGNQHYRKTVVIEKGHHKTTRTVSTFRDNGHRDHRQKKRPDRHNARFQH